jgi:TetR/AcrR family transcriptional repressor of lmrAB and yxaGH operons
LKAVRRSAEPDEVRAKILAELGEVFRTHGYEGASLSLITQATELGKGSLYRLFPGGKQQMAADVLAGIDAWFERHVFAPLREDRNGQGLDRMFEAVDLYFRSGRRVCLVGVFALGGARDIFGKRLRGYFQTWAGALAGALRQRGLSRVEAARRAEEILLGIQGALVLARANGDTGVFARALKRLRKLAKH